MNVLVISHTYITPINRDKWKTFASRYKDVTLKVVFPKKWPTHLFNHQAKISAHENTQNCTFQALDTFNEGNEVKYAYSTLSLMKLLKDFRPDVIHVEQGVHAFSYFQVILFSRLLGLKPKFSFFTWVNWRQKYSLKYRLTWKLIEKINLFFSSGAVVGNHDAKDILQEMCALDNVCVLPQLGVNQQIFQAATQTFKPRKKYIGYVGRMTPEKGIFHLAESFASLQEAFPNWNLLFVGGGPAEKQLIDYSVERRLLDRIEFREPVSHEQVADVMREIDVLVLPSYDTPDWKEQFGHVLIEAMACKVPIIGSTGGEIPNVIADSGLVFPQKDITKLTDSLSSLMNDEALRKELGEKGYQRMQKNYSHEVIADKTYTFWRGLMNYGVKG